MNDTQIDPASIFNDVLGPVMTGPSSSHTAGPARTGRAVRLLLGEAPAKARIVLKKDGAYPDTYSRQSSDKGFIAGLLGFTPDNEQFGQSLEIAANKGLDSSFEVGEIAHPHPNAVRILVQGKSGRELDVLTISTGGGMFELVNVDGHEVHMCGTFHELVAIGPDTALKAICTAAESAAKVQKTGNASNGFVQLTFDNPIPENVLREAKRLDEEGKCKIAHMEPILPVGGRFEYALPFMTAFQAAKHTDLTSISAADLALEYEEARSGLTKAEILERMESIVRVMERSAEQGLKDGLPVTGYMRPKAADMVRSLPDVNTADLGVMNRGMLIATAVMEYNSAGGIVVASPTAGSCGVLPAVVLSMAETMTLPETARAEALLAAGLVGVFIAHQATFAAEVCACQAEVGAATAMAAAAAVQLLGGNAQQAFAAAGLALQNVLGLICDPVAGLVAIPCVNRNSMGAANSIVSANMIMCGFDPIIPLDEVIVSMREVGALLPSALRCTTKGGLCTTPTAQRLSASLA